MLEKEIRMENQQSESEDGIYAHVPSFTSVTVTFCILISSYFLLRRNPRISYHLDKIGGPPQLPILGNALSFLRPHEEFIPLLFDIWVKKYKPIYSIWLGNFIPYVVIPDAKIAEKILSSNTHIEKGKYDYSLLHDWLGTGLLTAPGNKWQARRKMITPSFHFKILEDFLPVFNEQASILLDCLKMETGSRKVFNICPYIARCTLDIICETAMGKKMNAQTSASNKKYIDAVNGMCTLLLTKIIQPWHHFPVIYYFTSISKSEKEYLHVLKGFTENIIQDRKAERLNDKHLSGTNPPNDGSSYGKERKAFLDLLLDSNENDEILSDADIMEEVDTFMFEGHDTTAGSLSWTVWMLACHPECQKLVHQELDEIFADDPLRDVTPADISKMKYLEYCIKESLRLYPSVPFIMRQIERDIPLDNDRLIPRGVTAMIAIYYIHRDPEYYPEPLKYKPDRFSMENSAGRFPYAYIPFSAGSRNCIGQKFALLEEKVVLAELFRKYTVTTVQENVKPVPDIILRPSNGVEVTLINRA